MNRKIRIGAVSYLNTKPLIFGFEKGMMRDSIELLIDHPSNIAEAMLQDEIDIGLVPVAILPQMVEYHIISDYCIGCNGAVASVCLFSEVPLQEIETILLDYQSRTSAALVQVLAKQYWKINPLFKDTHSDFRDQITGTTAAIMIGDRAFEQRKISAYNYDLGLAWKQYTGDPFVFAAWVSSRPVDPGFILDFNAANEFGLRHLGEVILENPYTEFDLGQYYTRFIDYRLDEAKKLGMSSFLKKMEQMNVPQIPF